MTNLFLPILFTGTVDISATRWVRCLINVSCGSVRINAAT